MPKAANLLNREKSERSLGSLFVAARQKRGLPIEKAAHDTRIRIQRLREIEEDDFSQFSHPSYARLFLADYGRYLGIPVEDIRHLLPERGECGSEGYQYLQEVTVTSPSYSYTIPRPPKQRRIWPAVAGVCLVPCLLVVTFFGYKIVRDINRLNGHSTVAKATLPSEPADVIPATPEVTAPVAPAVAAPTEVGVDNAVPAADATTGEPAAASVSPSASVDPVASASPSDSNATAAVTPASTSTPDAATSSTTTAVPGVSPQTSVDDHAALLVGGSTDPHGRVQ